MQRALRLLPALAYMALIFYLSSQPAAAVGVSDKLLHFLGYGVLALALLYGLAPLLPGRGAWSWSFVIAALYGASDEWHQSFVPGRSPEVADALANTAGAAAALLLFAALLHLWPRASGRRDASS
jgi:VanZ family protein